MHELRSRATLCLTSLAAAASLAACSGSGITPSANVPASGLTPQSGAIRASQGSTAVKQQQLIYVGSSGAGTIDTFAKVHGSYQRIAQFADSNGPEGLHTDHAGDLYVADQGLGSEGPGIGDIAVYPPGASQPSRLIVPGYNVSDVIAVQNGRELYASNFGPDGQFGPGSVSVYGQASMPVRTMTIPNSFQATGVARDSRTKDVFASYSISSSGHIARFHHGRPPAVDIGYSFGPPWGIAEDRKGNLLVADGNGPIHIVTQSGKHLSDISVPGTAYRLAFNADDTLLFVTTFNNFDVEIFSYPAAKMLGAIHSSEWSKSAWPDGIAIWPPAE